MKFLGYFFERRDGLFEFRQDLPIMSRDTLALLEHPGYPDNLESTVLRFRDTPDIFISIVFDPTKIKFPPSKPIAKLIHSDGTEELLK